MKALEEYGEQIVKFNDEKKSLTHSNKKKFLKDLLVKKWKKYKI